MWWLIEYLFFMIFSNSWLGQSDWRMNMCLKACGDFWRYLILLSSLFFKFQSMRLEAHGWCAFDEGANDGCVNESAKMR